MQISIQLGAALRHQPTRNTFTRLDSVVAGLDPAIHPLRKTFLRRMMDPRVKPAGDGEGQGRNCVIAGLDPAIHPLREKLLRRRWTRGSSPRVTESQLLRLPTIAAST